jgi:hypothetical protein
MSRPRDLQIFWVVLFAGFFWAVIWQHEQAAKLWHMVSTAAVAMTSNLRASPPVQAAPPEDPKAGKAQHPASKTVPKGRE